MKIIVSQPAFVYANALYEIQADGNLILQQIKDVNEVFRSSSDLSSLLNNYSVSYLKKCEILDSVFADKIDPRLLKFLKILIEKKRINIFSEIVEAYNSILDEKNSFIEVEIVSAIELNEKYRKIIISKLQEKLHKNIYPKWSVSDDIIAGMILRYSDTVIDLSLSKKLNDISKMIK